MKNTRDTGNMNNKLIALLAILQVLTQVRLFSIAIHFASPILLIIAGLAAAAVHAGITPMIVHSAKWGGSWKYRYQVPMAPSAIGNVFLATSIMAAICNTLLVGLIYTIPGNHASAIPFAGLIAILGTAFAGGAVNAVVTVLEMFVEKK
jgi:uncharacterized membrane protein